MIGEGKQKTEGIGSGWGDSSAKQGGGRKENTNQGPVLRSDSL